MDTAGPETHPLTAGTRRSRVILPILDTAQVGIRVVSRRSRAITVPVGNSSGGPAVGPEQASEPAVLDDVARPFAVEPGVRERGACCRYRRPVGGHSTCWLARLPGGQKVASSNLAVPTIFLPLIPSS